MNLTQKVIIWFLPVVVVIGIQTVDEINFETLILVVVVGCVLPGECVLEPVVAVEAVVVVAVVCGYGALDLVGFGLILVEETWVAVLLLISAILRRVDVVTDVNK